MKRANVRHVVRSILAATVLLTGCQREISGGYMTKFKDGVCWLQLIRTPDNRLTGQLQTSELMPDGRLDRKSLPVTGAVNGSNVSISASKLGFEVTFSGTLSGSTLTLTGVRTVALIFTRADLSDYQQQDNALNARSQRILAAKASADARQRTERSQQDFISSIERVVAAMQKLGTEADAHLNRFPAAADRFRAITARVGEYVRRERQLAGNSGAGVARSQLSVAATQASLATEELHNSALTLQSSVQGTVGPVAQEAVDLAQGCRAAVPPGDLTPAQIDARNAACRQLYAAYDPFRQKLESLKAGLVHLEQVYSQEKDAQDKLLQAAQRLE